MTCVCPSYLRAREQLDVSATAVLAVLKVEFVLGDERLSGGEIERSLQLSGDSGVLGLRFEYEAAVAGQRVFRRGLDGPDAVVFGDIDVP